MKGGEAAALFYALAGTCRLREGKKDQPKKKEKSANVRDLEERLTRAMKTRVRLIEGKGQSGRLEVSYASFDELDRITEQLLD